MAKVSLCLAVVLLAVVAVSSQAGPMLQIERPNLDSASLLPGENPTGAIPDGHGGLIIPRRNPGPGLATQATLTTVEGDPTNPVPEPASLLLLGIGVASLAAKQRRRLLSRSGEAK